MSKKYKIPTWVTRGKSIRQLIDELKSFENQELEVRLSLDYGETHHPISILGRQDGHCVLMNAETHYNGPWQKLMDKPIRKPKTSAKTPKKKNKA